jgi:hypothetical protein
MPKEFLHCADVIQEMCGEGMAQDVTTHGLGQSRLMWADLVSKDFLLRQSLSCLYGVVIEGPRVGPRQWNTFLIQHPNRCLRLIELPWLHVGLLCEVAQKSSDMCGRSRTKRHPQSRAYKTLDPSGKPSRPGLGHPLPQDRHLVLLPELIDVKGFAVHNTSPLKDLQNLPRIVLYGMSDIE